MNNPFTVSTDWCKESSLDETLSFLTELALTHCRQAGPYSRELEDIIQARDWGRLVSFRIDYGVGSPNDLIHARQALALFEKLEQLPLGVDKAAVAKRKFDESEAKCRETNHRFRAARSHGFFITPARVASVLYTAQQKIASVLGDVPSIDEILMAYGPGANTGIKAKTSSARWKLDAQPECSADCVGVISHLLSAIPHYTEQHRKFHVDYNYSDDKELTLLQRLEDHLDSVLVPVKISTGKLQFVPKNAKTYRSIVVEPTLNSFAQKGIGSFIKGKLRRIGIDLRSQAERNKRLACRASFDGSLATIDLSSASDTISRELVAELLPYDWYSFLSSFRTGVVSYKGESIVLEKFSSMGNGYTFELETLIFWALSWACTAVERLDCREVCAFGDDILIPVEATQLLFEVLDYCGFEVNSEKSFVDGPFRESCGGDYVRGIDIRPYYQKDLISGLTLFTLHNFYVRHREMEQAEIVLRFIPDSLRIWGPDGYGDGHLIGDWHHAARITKKISDSGFGGVLFDTFTLKKRFHKKQLRIGDRLLPLYTIYVNDRSDSVYQVGYRKITNEGPIVVCEMSLTDNIGDPADHFVVRGHKGYRRVSIYTLSTYVFRR